jgi:hypothetical protein
MKRFTGIWLGLLLLAHASWAAAQSPIKVEMSGEQAQITLLTGTATVMKKGATAPQPLFQGDLLNAGDRIATGKNSRIEIRLPDNSRVRFDELTTCELEAASADANARTRDIAIKVLIGKTWARVSRLFSENGRFELSTETTIAGVRGTVYRMNVNMDQSAVVKVYSGEVAVKGHVMPSAGTMGAPSAVSAAPHAVSGPHPVSGPHAVSMEEWVYMVRSMQQINIGPDGRPTAPFAFSVQDDADAWVRWNQEMDAKVNTY